MRIKIALLLLLQAISWKSFAMWDTLNISFDSEGYRICGKLMAPKGRKSKMPAIIFLVGSGHNSSYATNYADFLSFFLEQPLSTTEIALLYFDKRGVGQSEGVWHQTDFGQRAVDARNAALYLKTLPFIDSARVFVVGHSQGGWVVQICLAEYPDVFAGGISMAGPAFGVKKQLVNDYQSTYICSASLSEAAAYRKARKKVNKVLAFTTLFPLKENWKQLKRIRKFAPQPYLSKIKRPILLMWGETDRLVSPSWCMEELSGIFPNGIPANFQTYIGAGEDHSFALAPFCDDGKAKGRFYSEISREKLINWLQSNLNAN
jgi:hypothetical protein